MTRKIAKILAPEVRVKGISPGSVLMPDNMSDSETAAFNKGTPLARVGSPDDVAKAMLFLLASDYVTGDVIIVDGGRHVRGSTA